MNPNQSFAFSLLLVLLGQRSVPVNSRRQTYVSYNGQCNGSNPCDPSAHLTCTSGLCQCESPSNQVYDSDSGTCQSSVGGACTLNPSPEGQTEGPSRLCIQNAHCVSVTSGGGNKNYTECVCNEGFLENSIGACVPGLGSPCNYEPEECNPLGMVVCKNGQCACLDSLQVYDPEMKRCVSPAGTHCKVDTVQLGCVKNALCYPFYYWIPARCWCKPGYIQTLSRTCVLEPSGASGGEEERSRRLRIANEDLE